MRKLVPLVWLLSVSVCGAAEQTWTGTITDSMCAKSHTANIEHALESAGRRMTEHECTVGCVARRGQKYVFVSNGKTYQIENQQAPELETHAAEEVRLSGTLKGKDTIVVSKVSAVANHR